MMKELLIGLAEYNQKANDRLIDILGKADAAVLAKDMGSYYKSVAGTLEHVLVAEIAWLKRFNGFFDYPSLAKAPLLAADGEESKARAHSGSRELFAMLKEADALLVAFTKELDEADLTVRVSFRNLRGEDLQRKYWNTIVHILNHGSHHRGEISAMLDMQGVANDYSGFNQYSS